LQKFKALQVEEISDKKFQSKLVKRDIEELPEGNVLIKVHYSSLNYKDALSASGNKAVTRQYPHTPGVDAAGIVVSSDDGKIAKGDEVIVI